MRLADFTDALEKIVLGRGAAASLSPPRIASAPPTTRPATRCSACSTPGADPVRKVSIVPRGQALGVTFQSPDTDRYNYPEAYLRGRIVGMLGGRAAEEIVYGETDTGAESDLEQVTRIARQMVGRWGMSDEVGPMSVLPGTRQEQVVLGGDAPSGATRQLVESEARRIVDECYARAVGELAGQPRPARSPGGGVA